MKVRARDVHEARTGDREIPTGVVLGNLHELSFGIHRSSCTELRRLLVDIDQFYWFLLTVLNKIYCKINRRN
jgi:hypothetical protein